MAIADSRDVLAPAKALKTMPLCEQWFFGGSHTWPLGTLTCTVRRRQKPPYQDRWTQCHEWDQDGRCVHCTLTRSQVKVKPSPTDTCGGCGRTRAQLLVMGARGEQPKLGCEDYGHVVARPTKPRTRPPLHLVIDNTLRGR